MSTSREQIAYLERAHDGSIPPRDLAAAERGEFVIPPTAPLPESFRVAITIWPETWPADLGDALKRELRRSAAFISGAQPWNGFFALIGPRGERRMELEFNLNAAPEVLRLRGAMARVVSIHCGAGSRIAFSGALAL